MTLPLSSLCCLKHRLLSGEVLTRASVQAVTPWPLIVDRISRCALTTGYLFEGVHISSLWCEAAEYIQLTAQKDGSLLCFYETYKSAQSEDLNLSAEWHEHSLSRVTGNEVSVIAAGGNSRGNPIRCRSCIHGVLFVSLTKSNLSLTWLVTHFDSCHIGMNFCFCDIVASKLPSFSLDPF